MKTTQVIASEPECWRRSVVTLTFGPKNVYVSSSHHPTSMNEIWKLYVEKCSSHCVRTKVLTKFRWDLDLLTTKCIGIFLSHPASMYEIWKLHVENYSTYRVRTKLMTKFRRGLDLWPFDLKMYSYLPLIILHLWMKYENYSSYCFRTRVLTKFRCDLDLWTFHLEMNRFLPLTILHLCTKY